MIYITMGALVLLIIYMLVAIVSIRRDMKILSHGMLKLKMMNITYEVKDENN